jgi:methylamine dehydrogenase heavy chain
MHRGQEGSHKIGGSEIWVFDTDTHKRLARWPIDTHRYLSIDAVAATHDAKPLLYATTDSADLLVLDPLTGRILRVARKVGQTPWFLVTP